MQLQVGGPFGRSRVRGANSVRKGWGEPGGRSLGDTNAAKSRRVSPGRSSPRGSSSPLGGSCYPRRKPSRPAGRAGAAPHPGRPRPGPAQRLPPPCALHPPARPPGANKPNRGGSGGGVGGARTGAARRGPLVRSAGQARRKAGGRARPREGRRRLAAPETGGPEGPCGAIGGRALPFLLLFFLAAGPG